VAVREAFAGRGAAVSGRIPEDASDRIREECANLGGLPLEDIGPIVCSEDVDSGHPAVLVKFLSRHPVYMLDNEPFNPRRIAERMRGYLSPQPSIGQMVKVLDDGAPARVVFINMDKHEFGCETDAGGKRGPYRFGDMMITWRKV
jgi:hypothetical protein